MRIQRSISGALIVASLVATVAIAALLLRWLAQQHLTTVAVGVPTIAALALLVAGVARARKKGDLDSSTLLVLAVGWLPTLSIVVAVASGRVGNQLDITRNLAPVLPSWYSKGVYLGLGVLIALAATLLAMRLVSRGRHVIVNSAVLFAILLWLVTWLASGLQGGPLIGLSGGAMLACLLAAGVLPRGRGACLGAGIFGASLAVASGILAVVSFDHATVPCQGYCPLGPAFSGVFQNENLLATALVASLPFIYLGFRGRLRVGLLLYVGAMVVVTASRGGIATAVIIIGALLVLRPQLDGVRPRPVRTAIAGLLLAASLFAAAYIVERDAGLSNYHLDDRPQLWSVASTYIDKSPLFGWGPDTWETLYTERGLIPSSTEHSTHNQFVDVLYRAGWVGLAVLFAMMVALVRSAGPARSAMLLALATVFLIGISERAWSIGTIDFASFSLIATLLLGPAAAAGPARAARRIGRSSSATRAHVMVGADGAR